MDRQKLDEQLRGILDQVRQRIVEGASPSLQSMLQMEELIYGELNRSKAQVLQAWCNQAGDDTARPACPHCGGPMRHKGYRKRTLICDSGQVELDRARWWCDACKASFSPSGQPGERGGLSGDSQGRAGCDGGSGPAAL
jgi:hypothetical protein